MSKRALERTRLSAGEPGLLSLRPKGRVRGGGASVGENVASASQSIASTFGVPTASPVPCGAWVEIPPQLPARLSWPEWASVWRIQPGKASFLLGNPKGLPPPAPATPYYSLRQILNQGRSAPQGACGTVPRSSWLSCEGGGVLLASSG